MLPLKNSIVLVTRPGSRGAELVSQLSAVGAETHSANILEIQLQADSAEMRSALSEIQTSTILVFVSVHAVNALEQALILNRQTLPAGVRIAAVGEATAGALKKLDMAVAFSPLEEMNSEGLIACFKDISLSNQKVILFRGQTGRTLLSETFRERGATVIEIESYSRRYQQQDFGPVLSGFTADKQRTVIVTSVELLEGLVQCLSNQEQKTRLFSSDLVVLSQRIADAAIATGFAGQVVVARETSNAGLLKAALSLRSAD